MVGEDATEVITPFQRLMQTPLLVAVYEKLWRRAGYYLASSRSFQDEMQTILRLQRGGGGLRLLDLACGTGVFTRPLAKQCEGVVVGLDLSRPMLRLALRLVKRDALGNVFLVRGSAARIPFIDGAFERINCCGALHLFDRPDDALREMARVMHPDGRLSVQTTIRPAHSGGLAFFLERLIRFGFFEEADLRQRVARQRLKILESERHRISFTFLARYDS